MSLLSFLFLLIFPVAKNHMGDIAQVEALLPFSLGGSERNFEPGQKVWGWDGDGGSLKSGKLQGAEKTYCVFGDCFTACLHRAPTSVKRAFCRLPSSIGVRSLTRGESFYDSNSYSPSPQISRSAFINKLILVIKSLKWIWWWRKKKKDPSGLHFLWQKRTATQTQKRRHAVMEFH